MVEKVKSRLKKLKESPLLNPPKRDTWWTVTDEDNAIIKKHVEEVREGKGFSDYHGQVLYYSMKLGIPIDITDKDITLIRNHLKHCRSTLGGLHLAGCLYHMKKLGLQESITLRDKQKIRKALGEYRETGIGRHILQCHHYMRGLGTHTEVTTQDINCAIKDVMDFDGEYKPSNSGEPTTAGLIVAEALFDLRNLGEPIAITEKRMRLFRGQLTEYRKRKDGRLLALMQYCLYHILPSQVDMEKQLTMPPLKKFAK